ncbi:thiamine phosphate synthase [Elioraea tepida]|uniref:Thiamine phosphate synthase n=1 Tax=Elioraea tepida TaxID=2843330 RepID=A0A975YKR8_9PROT|nr:thiamine phosphate synthase [Elioraea tepida]QXM26021.1 thiamine phosphate synthase [Elioraea tepida]
MARSLAEAARVLRRRAGALPYLILMTDERRGGDPLAAASRLPPGAAVILRHDGVSGRASLAASLGRLCRSRRLRLLVARDARLALSLRAGLHLAEGMRPPAPFRLARRRPRRPLLTIAAHGMAALARAHRLGADLALLSPLFPTVSHPGARPLGTLRFASLARRAGLPVAALGGVTASRVAAARAAGAAAVASVGALSGSR